MMLLGIRIMRHLVNLVPLAQGGSILTSVRRITLAAVPQPLPENTLVFRAHFFALYLDEVQRGAARLIEA